MLTLFCLLLQLTITTATTTITTTTAKCKKSYTSLDRKLVPQRRKVVNEAPTVVAREDLDPATVRKTALLSVFLPWLYFMANSINTATLPKYINWVINKGDSNVSERSATVYGNIAGVDSLFTFLSVNMVGCLSDIYGRKPFMFYSSAGLATTYLLYTMAQTPSLFYVAACIDGMSSCMLSQAQAYITDIQQGGADLSVALSKFQGIAIGLAFVCGIPLGIVCIVCIVL